MTSIEENKLPVLLSIRGEQYFDGIDPDETELMTEGTMELADDGIVLSYEESELTGMEGTTTTFEVKGPRVTLTRSGTVLTPVDTKVLMRPILSRQEAEDFIAQLPQLPPEEPESRSMRLLKEFYQQIVTSYDCRRMAGLIRSAVRRRKHALRTGRKVSQMDERYLRRAENALYGELAAALDLPEEEVLPYIRRTCPQWP